MIEDEESIIDALTPLLKIVKDRQSLYFEVFTFTNKNIQSSSNDFDQIYLFNKSLSSFRAAEVELVKAETIVLHSFTTGDEDNPQSLRIQNHSKELTRLFIRVLEILQSSVEKVRNSLFGENGKLNFQFNRLKASLHKIVKKQSIELHDFGFVIINFCKSKYRKQISKLQAYVRRLQTGDQISLREVFNVRDGSDVSVSPDERKTKKKISTQKKLKNDQSGHSSSQAPNKRASVKKVTAIRPKRTLNLKNPKKDESLMNEKVQKKEKPSKAQTAQKLLKFYAMMELNKKEFLEDYLFQQQEQEEHKRRLMMFLMEKNKFNSEQIKQHYKKCDGFDPAKNPLPNPSSDENASMMRNQSSGGSKISIKTSFVITKRKPSYSFESSNTDKSDIEIYKNELPVSRTIKNLSTRKRTTQSNTPRQESKNKSKKIFVVKAPTMFEDDSIPKAPVAQNKWLQNSLTGRQKPKRNEQLRAKKRNNPMPLDNSCLPQSFNFTQYPL